MAKLQIPTPGRIVLYKLTADEAKTINGMISDARTRERRCIGNKAEAGDVLPMIIVKAWGNTPESSVNGQVFLDGIGTLWITSRSAGEHQGGWMWPEHVAPVESTEGAHGGAGQQFAPDQEDAKQDLAESRMAPPAPGSKKPKKSKP